MGTHDVVILGGGPGGYVAAERLGAAALIEQELRIDDVKQFVFPHPTVSETIREAAWVLG